jgi:hypothetical protein
MVVPVRGVLNSVIKDYFSNKSHRRKADDTILLAIMGQGWSSAAAPPEVVRIHNCVCARASFVTSRSLVMCALVPKPSVSLSDTLVRFLLACLSLVLVAALYHLHILLLHS